MSNLKNVIEESFTQYAAAVIQSRALVDARDGLKPSARQIFYCMNKYKYTADKPFQPTAAAMGDAMKHFYIHGDSSCVGIIMRAGQPFAMRYPLVDIRGNAGTLLSSGNWAAERYTKARLSKLSTYLFEDIDKETISEWRDNYADNEQYPAVLPTKGFYNIVNGTQGIAVGAASSIPQYNLKDLNNALIYLIDNPNCSFEEIYCAPDFATGAILYNEEEVKESMKNGTGCACKLRSLVDFDSKERCFVVTEIPYSVYTDTICGQLEEIVNGEDNPGIERFNDLTGSTPLIKIYLTKKANPDKVLKYLYKNTSLQYHYGINFTMLDNGRFPKVFTWKEMLQAHIDHECKVYRSAFQFDLNKIKERIHIIDGLLICLASIEEVVQTIRSSASTTAASLALQEKFLLDAHQTKAVLDMKLSRLAHLEVQKLENEREELQIKADTIQKILDNDELFKEEVKKGWREVADKFGDARRTKIFNEEEINGEPVEIKALQVSITNKSNIYAVETSSLYTQKRGGVGNKFKMDADEFITNSIQISTDEDLLVFTKKGEVAKTPSANIPIEQKTYVGLLCSIEDREICAIAASGKSCERPYLIFFTKKGIIKKSSIDEYKLTKKGLVKAISLIENDEIVSVYAFAKENAAFLTRKGNFLMIETKDISAIGRASKGIQGIKLEIDDEVVAAKPVKDMHCHIVTVSQNGNIKKTVSEEFKIQGRATKGVKVQKLEKNDFLADFDMVSDDKNEVIVAATKSCIKLLAGDINESSRYTVGTKSIKLKDKEKVIALIAQ